MAGISIIHHVGEEDGGNFAVLATLPFVSWAKFVASTWDRADQINVLLFQAGIQHKDVGDQHGIVLGNFLGAWQVNKMDNESDDLVAKWWSTTYSDRITWFSKDKPNISYEDSQLLLQDIAWAIKHKIQELKEKKAEERRKRLLEQQ